MNKSAAALLLAVLAASTAVFASAEEPLKIGWLSPMSGIAANPGKDLYDGFTLFLDETHQSIGGRRVKVVVADDKGSPSTAVAGLEKLVNEDHVDVLAGGILANVGYVLAPKVDEAKVPMIYPVMASDDLTQRQRHEWVVRTGWSSSQPTQAFGDWVYRHLGYKKVAIYAMDYSFGWEEAAGFQKAFEAAGGKVVQKVWAPLGGDTWAQYISKIRPDADAVFAVTVGAAAVAFPKEYAASGLKLPVLGGGPTFDESVFAKMDDAMLGSLSGMVYSAALATPANKKFASAFKKKYGRSASAYSEMGFTAGMWIDKAVKSLKGDVSDKAKLLAALKKVELVAPRGPVKLDSYGNPVENVYVRKLEKKDGAYENTVVDTIPNVSQFWTTPAEDFLKQPVYSREFPACPSCEASN